MRASGLEQTGTTLNSQRLGVSSTGVALQVGRLYRAIPIGLRTFPVPDAVLAYG